VGARSSAGGSGASGLSLARCMDDLCRVASRAVPRMALDYLDTGRSGASHATVDAVRLLPRAVVLGRRMWDLGYGFQVPLRWTPDKVMDGAMRRGCVPRVGSRGVPNTGILGADGQSNEGSAEFVRRTHRISPHD
jgi:hypothetical protein